MQENGITLQGRPIVPAGLPEFRSDHMAEEKHEQDASTIRDLSARVKELEEHKRQQAELNERQATTIDLLRRQLRENDTRHLDEIRHLRSELAGAKSQAETTADELKKTQDDLVSTLRRAEEVGGARGSLHDSEHYLLTTTCCSVRSHMGWCIADLG